MRSKEVEGKIKELKHKREYAFKCECDYTTVMLDEIDTVLAYIEELEKENIKLKNQDEKDFTSIYLYAVNEYKNKIRDKIKELKEKTTIAQGEELLILEAKIDMLEEIIGE